MSLRDAGPREAVLPDRDRRRSYRRIRCGLVLAGALVPVLPLPSKAQQRSFKVFISADMEGISGLTSSSQFSPGGSDYDLGRRLMTAEVNAAINAAFDAGATSVVVRDDHGSTTNLLPDQLDRRARLITGKPTPFAMMQGIDTSFAAVLFVGYHARGSTADAVFDHTYSWDLKSVKLNGREVGEYGLNAALAGHFGVPAVFISGDRAATEQAREFIPGIEAVAVKDGIGQTAALAIHPGEAQDRIAAGVKAALARRGAIAPVRLSRPVTIEIELASTAQADAAMLVPAMQRVGPRTVSYRAPDMSVAHTISYLIMRLASR